jgi:hypothetical protein
MDNDSTAKLIGYAIGGIVALYVFMAILPYLVMFLALVGAYYLWQEYNRNNRKH